MSITEAIATILNNLTPEVYAQHKRKLDLVARAIDVEAMEADYRMREIAQTFGTSREKH